MINKRFCVSQIIPVWLCNIIRSSKDTNPYRQLGLYKQNLMQSVHAKADFDNRKNPD